MLVFTARYKSGYLSGEGPNIIVSAGGIAGQKFNLTGSLHLQIFITVFNVQRSQELI
jgi:hypothetical protein